MVETILLESPDYQNPNNQTPNFKFHQHILKSTILPSVYLEQGKKGPKSLHCSGTYKADNSIYIEES